MLGEDELVDEQTRDLCETSEGGEWMAAAILTPATDDAFPLRVDETAMMVSRVKIPRQASVGALWTRLRCSRCRYATEHPGTPTLADLDRDCALCRSPLGAVTVYVITPRAR